MERETAWSRVCRLEFGRAVLWLPVGLGLGIWLFFALPFEPLPILAAAPLVPLIPLLTGHARRAGTLTFALALLLAACAAGFAAALLHAHVARAPVLAQMYEETVDGRVRSVDQSGSGAPRLTLDRVTIYNLESDHTPARLRISLLDTALLDAPRPGARIRVYARLFPPGGAVEPGGFEFRRQAWFEALGGVGYTRSPVLMLPSGSAADQALLWLAQIRQQIAEGLRTRLPGPEGAFAAAVLVGDRSGIQESDADALRLANLAHLLAISGLHMGILCGLVFAGVRVLTAAVPAVGLNLSGKKVAAAAALVAGASYLLLSGATVPTQRAFAMAGVALVAVLLDRPALTLRALAAAATLVLLIRPISLLEPGFQMSFAATAALIATFERFSWMGRQEEANSAWRALPRRAALYFGALVVTSVVAGLATAPFAAFHFNRLPLYGLPANLAAVPVMGLWIAPTAILSGICAPFGLADLPLAAMGKGIGLVLTVAHEVAAWPGSARLVSAAAGTTLALVTVGGLWIAIWQSRLRLLGLIPLLAGLLLWTMPPERPELLIAPGGRLVGLLGTDGRVIDHPRAQSFAAETWLRRDGDPAEQDAASRRPGLEHGRGWARGELSGGWHLEVVHGRRPDIDQLRGLCRARTLLIARHGAPLSGPCCYIGERDLAALGALAIDATDESLDIRAAHSGPRLWQSSEPPKLSMCGSSPPSAPGS